LYEVKPKAGSGLHGVINRWSSSIWFYPLQRPAI